MAGLNTEQQFRAQQEFLIAFEDTLKVGDAERLRALLTSPEGEAVDRTLSGTAAIAAATGDTRCLRVLQECGFVLNFRTWVEAVAHGHVNCLAFAVSHGYELQDTLVEGAVCKGQMACVEFLLQQGLPRKPYTLNLYCTGPDQLKCIQLMLDKGAAVSPQTLIEPARRGDLDLVRWLHERGVPLWDHAQDERFFESRDPFCPPDLLYYDSLDEMMWRQVNEVQPGTLYISWHPPASLWKVLRYGARHGAPINDRAKQIMDEPRRQTHAVLLCFKAAARLCQAPGCAGQTRVWDGMAALPSVLVEELLIAADLEIQESMTRHPPLEAPAVAGR